MKAENSGNKQQKNTETTEIKNTMQHRKNIQQQDSDTPVIKKLITGTCTYHSLIRIFR